MLSLLADTLNTQVHDTTKHTPYELVFGQPPWSNIVPDITFRGKLQEEDIHLIDDEPMQPTDDEPMQPTDDEPMQPTDDEPIQPTDDEPMQLGDDKHIPPTDDKNTTTLATIKTHLSVREKADILYRRNAEKMKMKHAKKRKIQNFSVGDNVSIRIPRIDRSSTDCQRLPCVVVEIIGKAQPLYRVRSAVGVLTTCYHSGDLEYFHGSFNVLVEGWQQCARVSMRYAAQAHAPWNHFTTNSCHCKSGCHTQKCNCKKSRISCSSHCHKGTYCNNKIYDDGRAIMIEDEGKASSDDSGLGMWILELGLTKGDKADLKNSNCLNDRHITAAQNLISNQYRHLGGFQSPLLCQKNAFTGQPGHGIQILFDKGHWLTSASCNGEVLLFDSMSKQRTIRAGTQTQLAQIYEDFAENGLIAVRMEGVQQQIGGKDCGLFAIAFAYHLANGDDLSKLTFNQGLMRQHTFDCFEKKNMSPYPLQSIEVDRSTRRISYIHLYCNCNMPEGYDIGMVQCDWCKIWYHYKCIGLTKEPKGKKWKCYSCKQR